MRTLLLLGALAALLLGLLPPIFTDAHGYEFVETVQFDLFGLALPALLVLGWPLRVVPGEVGHRLREWALRLNEARRRHPSTWRAIGFASIDVAALVCWRTPPLMDALERQRWLLAPEIVSLVVAGLPLWIEMVPCPPLEPRAPHPWRGVVGALTMWSVWVLAYVIGFSDVSWYVAYHHVAHGIGASADQELSTGALFFGAAAAFLPVIFTDLLAWLRNGEDPDAELRAIVRKERWWGKPD
jgi:cytochrome c oxidase assembly factor CtaG